MAWLTKTVFLLLFLLLLAAGSGTLLMVQDSPVLAVDGAMTTSDLQQARGFLGTADPRRLAPGQVARMAISPGDLELLLNYLLGNLYGGVSRVALGPARAEVTLSAALPPDLPGSWLNIRAVLVQEADMLVLDALHIGRLPVPGRIANAIMLAAHAELGRRVPEYVALQAAVETWSLREDGVELVYRWQPELLEQISSRGRELLIGPDDRARLFAHARHLSELTRDPALPARLSLARLLGPMLDFAGRRPGDPVEENRAALQVLSLYVLELDIAALLGEETSGLPAPRQRLLTLAGRQDFARHFLVSAGLAGSAGGGLASSVGLLKEIEDGLEGGSGFSFVDLAADRTGIRFAQLAVAGPEQARAVQRLFGERPEENIFVPEINDLPEYLAEEEFRSQYGGIGEPAYNLVIDRIEARIAALPLFRDLE